MFKYMASILNEYHYQGKNLDAVSSYQYGPICVAEEYRARGVGEMLLEYQRKVFATALSRHRYLCQCAEPALVCISYPQPV